jgi:hypothetical protein
VLKQVKSVIHAQIKQDEKHKRKKNLMTLDLPYETGIFIVVAVIIVSIVSIIAKAVVRVKGRK